MMRIYVYILRQSLYMGITKILKVIEICHMAHLFGKKRVNSPIEIYEKYIIINFATTQMGPFCINPIRV